MYKVELYIDGVLADMFGDESIEMTLTTQNVKDISKNFGDYTNGFTLPASPKNNGIFKHYYNVDLLGGFDANLRVDAFIEINNNLFRQGVLELEEVQLKNNEPTAYSVTFYSNTTSLKDLFGEDTLNDLDLSAQDHTYNDTNLINGLVNYVAGTGDAVIYPLISPVRTWYYNSSGSDHVPENIYYHSGHNEHGVFFYDIKPAVKLQKIIDAIETKYGVTFDSDFFSSSDFGKLFMWCHRRAGYMFKDQDFGFTPTRIQFTSATNSNWDLSAHSLTIDNTNWTNAAGQHIIGYSYDTTSTSDYKIQAFVNGEMRTSRPHSGNVTGQFVRLGEVQFGDVIDFRISVPDDWNGSPITINTIDVDIDYFDGTYKTIVDVSRSTSQSVTRKVFIADQLPEQKITDFIGSLIRAFNLAISTKGNMSYYVEPLDDWYADGTTHEISKHIDTSSSSVKKTELYRRISFSYNETEAILGEQFRLQNDIGYGDLRADFNYDGEDFDVEVGFDNMLFERLSDQNGGALTSIGIGRSVTRELEPYIGSPFIFYLAGQVTSGESFAYIPSGNSPTEVEVTSYHLPSNVNALTAPDVTKTLNFGAEIDPYIRVTFTEGLYDTYWKDYITDLYDASRRLFVMNARLPLHIMLNLKNNDKLTINARDYIINSIKMNLTTGEASLELLNDV